MRIQIEWDNGSVKGTLEDTPTARALVAALPFSSRAHTWGDEVYFEAPVQVALEPAARQVVDPGTVCFWVQGNSLALPFGPTPVSEGRECRLVTAVNILGRLDGDPTILASIEDGDSIRVWALDDG